MPTKWGIKEVADVRLIDLKTGETIAYLDTLKLDYKIAEEGGVYARGGKGNPKIWSPHAREYTFKTDDAVIDKGQLSLVLGYNVK